MLGYDDTVLPALENALLCGHDLIFLGERGQAKTRMIRSLVAAARRVDAGDRRQRDPRRPVRAGLGATRRALLAEHGDAAEIAWVHRDDRYVREARHAGRLDRRPDRRRRSRSKVAEGRSLVDELTIHFGLVPRTHRGIFCINELPDLTEKVQVGLFNVMEERDVQVKGYRVRLPLDVLVVASANPEDYTSRGRIITPLKDRYAAQIRTHYPRTRDLELAIVRQEARLPAVDGIALCVRPSWRRSSASSPSRRAAART